MKGHRLAIRDAIVILIAFRRMLLEAQRLAANRSGSDTRPDSAARYGPLTESLQVKAAIALARIERNGMCLDLDRVRAARSSLGASRDAAVAALRESCPELFKTRVDQETGAQVLRLAAGGTTALRDDVLQANLARVLDDLRQATGEVIAIPKTRDGNLSTSLEHWSRYAHQHPFLERWLRLKDTENRCQFLACLRESPVHARYRCLVRTGRTACSGPNLQQVPRDGMVRHAFVPSPGFFLLSVDYSSIDLRALAAVCLHRYGRSVLAEVIKQGIDPHAHTAAMILGIPLDEFRRWKEDGTVAERRQVGGREQVVTYANRFKEMRDAAKAINFGVPAGLGITELVRYARNSFGVAMTTEQANGFRDRLTRVVYPELELYLADDELASLARNLGATEQELRRALNPDDAPLRTVLRAVRDVVSGRRFSSWGPAIDPGYHDRLWEALGRLCTNPDLGPALATARGGEGLARRLFAQDVATLTGRIRGGVDYGPSRNTPFQGLAADGAKLALWRLVREGFRVVGFVHDEVLVELPDEGGFVSEEKIVRIKEIMCGEMEEVLGGNVPVDCEATLSTCWSKHARLIVREGKVFPWSPG